LLFSGENLKYYPKNSHLVVVDHNVYIHAYLDSNPGLTSNVNIERVIVSSEYCLEEAIPDSSIDAVVATFVLCSVTSINLILSEIKRILAPVNRNLDIGVPLIMYAFLNPMLTDCL
jgi:ubiquinone/menaquinone biosynthesis C-methylase UbiE